MGELIMATNAEWFNKNFSDNPIKVISVNESIFYDAIESNCTFIDRSIAETEKRYKQIVSYCLISCEDDWFITRRTNKQTEKRLHNLYSFGIGGHISSIDTSNERIVIAGMLRELNEEVDIQCDFDYSFLGIINDNSTEVNSVHTGVCFVINLEKKMCSVKESEKMEGFWINKSEMAKYMDHLEGWSKILVNSI